MDRKGIGRREFLAAFLGGTIATGLSWLRKDVPGPARVVRWLYEASPLPDELTPLKGQLFGIDGRFSVKWGKVHPKFPGGHPDDQLAARTLLTQVGPSKYEDEPWDSSPDSHLFLLGDPQSNALSRLVLCHEEDQDGIITLERDPLYQPRYSYATYPPDSYEGPKTKRYVGGQVQERPIYEIRDHESGKSYASNDVIPGEWLNNEYLLVTRVINTWSLKTVESGKIATVFAGLHGTGTRAIDLLFSDEKLLERTNGERNKRPFYQALYRVSIQHDATQQRSFPRDIELVNVEPLELDQREIWERLKERQGHGTPNRHV